jgi:hypothetical protein
VNQKADRKVFLSIAFLLLLIGFPADRFGHTEEVDHGEQELETEHHHERDVIHPWLSTFQWTCT